MQQQAATAGFDAISSRRMKYVRSRGLLFAFEDLAEELGLAQIVAPVSPYANRWHSGLVSRLHPHSPGLADRMVDASEVTDARGDVRLIVCQVLSDLPFLLPFFTRRRDSRMLACLVEEAWIEELPSAGLALDLLRRCDLIFVGSQGAVEAIGAATGKPTVHLPPSVDASSLNPFAGPPKARSIELYYMGRRDPVLHQGLLEWSAGNGQFYLYDTAGNALMTDHRDHRRHLGDLIQRSRFFIVAPGKSHGEDRLRQQQDEVGYRYYEGAGCGAILLGTANNSPLLGQHFDYDDAVFALDGSAAGLLDTLARLGRDEGRLGTIRRQGVANVLRRHDYAHRWKTVVQCLGLPEPLSLAKRIGRLQQTADDLLRPQLQPGRAAAPRALQT